MPTEEQNLDQLREAIGRAEMQPAKEPSYEDKVLFYMTKVLETARQGKPLDRNERARRYAVTITEMEKVFAYFKTFVVDYIDPVEK